MGNNVAGLNGKVDSLVKLNEVLKPGVIMLQETKLYKQGKVNLKGFVCFEKLRQHGGGGGLMTAAHENLNPVLIDDDEDNTEMIIVDIKYKSNCTIRTINCYGPQEHSRKKKKNTEEDAEIDETETSEDNFNFFLKLETQIKVAKNVGNLICIQMDANSKFGKNIIKDDPSDKMSENGKALFDIIENENLVLVNSTDKCLGTITRYRKTTKKTEIAVLDFFILCRRLYEMLLQMTIDEDRIHVLTKYSTKNGVKKVVVSDHNPMWCEFDLKWSSFIKPSRKVEFNFKNNESIEAFKAYNDENETLINCLQDSSDIISGGRKWFSELKDSIHKSFKKIRMNSQHKDKILQELLNQKLSLKKEIKKSQQVKIPLNVKELNVNLDCLEEKIANHLVTNNLNRISKHVEELCINGKFDNTKMWKLRRRLCPKNLEKPSAKLNEKGKLITDKTELKELYKQTYIQRLHHRIILPQYQTIFGLKNYLFDLRMKVTSKIKSPDWSMPQLIKVLKNLKNNKSGDHFSMIYELFKPGVIGIDLQKSLLILFNEIKNQQKIPNFFKYTDITSFFKQKDDRHSLENDRGIFGVVKLRSILENQPTMVTMERWMQI